MADYGELWRIRYMVLTTERIINDVYTKGNKS